MGRRRRTKVARRPRPKLPTIFDCPICAKKALSVTFQKEPNSFDIRCTNCGKKYHYNNPTRIPVKFGCPNCNEKAVGIEFIESTNSIRINCSSCEESTFVSAKEWERDPDHYSLVKLVPHGSKLGCPKCDFRALMINIKLQEDYAIVQCGACKYQKRFSVTTLDEKVDVYGKLIDYVRSDEFEEYIPEAILEPTSEVDAQEVAQGGEQEVTASTERRLVDMWEEEEEEDEVAAKEVKVEASAALSEKWEDEDDDDDDEVSLDWKTKDI